MATSIKPDNVVSHDEKDQQLSVMSPLKIRSLTFRNRLVMPPMALFTAEDGFANDFHFIHYGARAIGGLGGIIVEVTSVTPNGRISPSDLGAWKDEHIAGLKHLADTIAKNGCVPGIQLGHAGRKGSTGEPYKLRFAPVSPKDGGWPVVGPSPIAVDEASAVPLELSVAEIKQYVDAFVTAAKRVLAAGFKFIEIHAAHGYLLHQFLSPLSNKRTDAYGGSLENRSRFVREVAAGIRAVMPAELPLFVRLSCTDWVENSGWNEDETVKLVKMLKQESQVDLIDCSSGGLVPYAKYNPFSGYQVPFAEKVWKETGVLTGAVGLLTQPKTVNDIILKGQAQIVLIGREELRDAHFPLRCARELGLKDAERSLWCREYAWAVAPK